LALIPFRSNSPWSKAPFPMRLTQIDCTPVYTLVSNAITFIRRNTYFTFTYNQKKRKRYPRLFLSFFAFSLTVWRSFSARFHFRSAFAFYYIFTYYLLRILAILAKYRSDSIRMHTYAFIASLIDLVFFLYISDEVTRLRFGDRKLFVNKWVNLLTI